MGKMRLLFLISILLICFELELVKGPFVGINRKNTPHVTFADEEKSNDSDEKLNNSSVVQKNVSSANSIANSKEHESHEHGESNELEHRKETKESESAGRERTIQSSRNGRNGRKLTENEREEKEKDTLTSIAQEDIKEIMNEYSNEAKEIELENGLEYVLALFDGHFRFLCPTMGAKEFPWKNWQKNCHKWESLWKPFRNWIQLLAIVNAKQSLDSDVNIMYLTVRPMLKSKNGQNGGNLLVKTIKAFIEIRTNPKGENGEKKGGFTELEPPEWKNPNEFEYVNELAEFCKREYSRHKKYSIKESEQFQEAKAQLRILLEKENKVLAGKENKHFEVDHRFKVNVPMPRASAYNRRLHGPSAANGHYNPPRSNYNYPHSHYSAEDQHHLRSHSPIPHPLHPAKFRPHLYKNQFRQHTTHPAGPPVKKMPSFRHLDAFKQRYLDANHPTMLGPKNGIMVI